MKQMIDGARKYLASITDNFGFAVSIGWNACRLLMGLRILTNVLTSLTPALTLWVGREVVNVLASAFQMGSGGAEELRHLAILLYITGLGGLRLENAVQ